MNAFSTLSSPPLPSSSSSLSFGGQDSEPKIWFCGDTHGRLDHIEEAFRTLPKPDAVVHLGDFDLHRPLSELLSPELAERFWWIPGNHDFDLEVNYTSLFQDRLVTRCLHGRQAEIASRVVAGLGGTFKGRIWYPPAAPKFRNPQDMQQRRQPSAPRTATGAIWPDMVTHLSCQRAEVLVTHEAPSSHHHGFAALDALASDLGATLMVHGHHHEDYEGVINGGRTRVLGVGFRGITDQQGNRVVPGALSNQTKTKREAPKAVMAALASRDSEVDAGQPS